MVAHPHLDSDNIPFSLERNLPLRMPWCYGLVAMTGYSDLHFPYRTADSSFLDQ
jgi:hypothetical protein